MSTLIHLAETLAVAVESTLPGRDKTTFEYEYALGYVRKALQAGRQRKATADAPATVRARRVSGQDAVAADNRPLQRIRSSSIPDDERYDWQEERGSRTWTEYYDDTVREIVQNAFMRFWKARKKSPIDTRRACSCEVKDWQRSQRKNKPIRKRCEACIYEDEACETCVKRLAKDRERWAKANRKTANSTEGRDTLADIADRPAETWTDLLPDTDGSKTRTYIQGLIRWLASGSTPTDWAEYANATPDQVRSNEEQKRQFGVKTFRIGYGVDESYARKLLKKLRSMYVASDFVDTVGATYPITGRIYGDRPTGNQSERVGAIADLLDAILPHTGLTVSPHDGPLPSPTWQSTRSPNAMYIAVNREAGHETPLGSRSPVRLTALPVKPLAERDDGPHSLLENADRAVYRAICDDERDTLLRIAAR